MRTAATGLPLAVALAAIGACGPATAADAGWYVDCSNQLIAFLDQGQQGQAQAQCDDRKPDGLTAPVRTTLEAASDWLVKSHGFPPPRVDPIPIQGDDYFVAVVYLGDREDFCKDRVACFLLDDRRVYVHDAYVRGAEKVVVHELFHAVQLAYKGPGLFEVLATQAQALSADNMNQLRGWIVEGTAEAVGLAWASRNGSQMGSPLRRYDAPLHKPASAEDTYNTAGFWQFIGKELESAEGIAYLDELFQRNGLAQDNGVAAVDAHLNRYGGLSRMFPRFVAGLPFEAAFGTVANWQLRLAAGTDEVTRHFSGRVRQIAGTAGRLSVSHDAENPVELTIRFRGDDSDLHLIVDGRVQKPGLDGVRNDYRKRLEENAETFEVVVAEVAERAGQSREREFELEITMREVGDAWVRVNGEFFRIKPGICNHAGVVAAPDPDERSIMFAIRAPGGETRVDWGAASVSAELFAGGCEWSGWPPCTADIGGEAGGPRIAGNPPKRFNVAMDYDMKQGIWTGSGHLYSDRSGAVAVEFVIQCDAANRALIR